MKKLALMMLLICGSAFADNTYTTNAGIPKPADSDTGWGETIRDAFDIIDSSFATLSGTQTFTGGVTLTSATITSGSAIAFNADDFYMGNTMHFGPDLSHGGYDAFQSTAPILFSNTILSSLGTASIGFYNTLGPTGTNQITDVAIIPSITLSNSISGEVSALTVQPTFSITNTAPTGASNAVSIYPTFGGAAPSQINAALKIGNTSSSSASNKYVDTSTTSIQDYGIYVDLNSIASTTAVRTSGYFSGGNFAVVGSTSNAYSLLVGTNTVGHASAPSFASSNYHVTVATSGAFGYSSITAATIRATKPTKIGESFYCSDCATVAVCVSTGTAVNQWALITNKGSACN